MQNRQKRILQLLIYPLLIIAILAGCTDPLGTGDNSSSREELMRNMDPDRLTPEGRDWLAWFVGGYSEKLQSNHRQYIQPLLDDLDAFMEAYAEDGGNAGMFESLAAFSKGVAEVEVNVDLEDYYQPVAEYAWDAHDMFNQLAEGVNSGDRASFEKASEYARSCQDAWEYLEFFIALDK